MGWLGPMAIESKMQPFLTAFNKKLGQQLYHCLEKSIKNRLVVEKDGMIYCYNMQPPYDVIII